MPTNTTTANRTLEIVESTYVPTPCGKGMILRCLTQEIGGPDAGRLAKLDFTLEHADQRIQERGQRAFAALRRAVGVLDPEDSEELHWKEFRFPFSIEPRGAA
ncbi:putative protein OS=Bosea thiooxidans OX=53254 GN=SAMN05660750_04069 PE=4 SV=1 [Bosea thiooxidans]|uniref:Uncharacterized protein n=1 Tax=Bosea thiooxidans TaxID=53254 RepID=A0A1T5GI25_9HYPH|nr:hypothetical protein [Bosea thiooxidans]SKC08035.1 hypothetical protein SAMN05660750_04069 [Bosea thiooxidans]